jgi:hypothetical protein
VLTDFVRRAMLLSAGLITAAALAAPPAYAEGGVPGEPFPAPSPGGMTDNAGNGCQGGEVRVDGNCIPGGGAQGEESRTTESWVNPADNIPNINGDPCEGAWVSTVCYAEGNVAPVQPHSELSASP